MASIRRNQSLAHHDWSYTNGGSPLASNRLTSSSSSSSSDSAPFVAITDGFRRLLMGIFLQKQSRKGGNSPWKRFFYRFLLCFMIGMLLGFFPFPDVEDLRGRHDIAFEIMSPPQQDLVAGGSSVRNRAIETVKRTVIASVEPVVRQVMEERFDSVPRKPLIVVTPTYNRPLQAFYLNRLGQTLRLVRPPLLWIVVEMDSMDSASTETAEMLRNTGVMYRHLVCKKNLSNVKDRGVHQRNAALEHIEVHKLDGIVYFADDDNVYSLELFERMREIRRFGTWPVAMLAQSKNKAVLEGPICNGSQVVGWHTNEKSKRLRRFHVDMSGFAFNSTILWDPKRWHRLIPDPIRQLDKVKEGFQETTFIEQVVEDESQMEAMPLGCSRIMSWHLHLEAHSRFYPRGWLLQKNLDVVVPLKQ